jgi:G3E family GTPase
MINPAIPITILTGFLGSGKTTVLRRALRQNALALTPLRVGVLVNDMSELDVDGEIIEEMHLVSVAEGTLVRLSAGTLSSNLLERFSEGLDNLLAAGVEAILVETSGSNHPVSILEFLRTRADVQLQHFICLVDAVQLLTDFGAGTELLNVQTISATKGFFPVSQLLREQLQCADRILLTKLDRLPESQSHQLLQNLEQVNPTADIHGIQHGQTTPSLLWGGAKYDFKRLQKWSLPLEDNTSDALIAGDYDIGSEVIRDPRPFHPERLWQHFRERLGLGIHRSKGYLWLASRGGQVLLWNQTGGSLALELTGYWRASILADPSANLTSEERNVLLEKLATAHPRFGDRHCELTVIGTASDRSTFIQGLRDCFCTESEIIQWEQGGLFHDPWPQQLRRV